MLRLRQLVLLVAALATLALCTRLGHHALVAHARCAAHGELVHAHEGHAASRAPASSDEQPSYRAGTPDDGAHEHCDAVAVAAGCLAPGAAAVAPLALDFATLEAPRLPWLDRSQLLLLLAPKTSPPRSLLA